MSKLWLKGILKLLLRNQIPICCFEETVARSLSLKSKSKEIFGALSQEQEQSTSPFSRVLLFWAREGRRRGFFTQSAQCQEEVIFLSQTSFFKISEILSAKEISINYTTYEHLCSSENFQSTQGREIEVLPKKLQKVHKWPINLRKESKPPKVITMSKEETKLVDQEIQEMLRKSVISLTKESEDQLLSTLFLVRTKDGGDRPLIHLKKLNKSIPYFHFKMDGLFLLK